MRVEVDPRGCEANAVCTGIVPEVFELDDDEVLHVKAVEVPAVHAEAVRRAVASCPKRALSLHES